jgi:hypothetical protein
VRRAGSLLLVLLLAASGRAEEGPGGAFAIRVVDGETGRGVPLVTLETTAADRFVTDNAGLVAFREPGWMGRPVYFHVVAHGYEAAPDGFGFRGVRLVPRPGEEATVPVRRLLAAERLCRLTGSGLYRDTVLLGRGAPVREPLLNARVTGQDSVLMAPYRGRLLWIWGDTNRPEHPLGNFGATGATTRYDPASPPDPSAGLDFDYVTGEDGFVRPLCPWPEEGAKWLDGLLVLPDADGRERLLAHYARVKSLEETYEHGLALFDDATATFARDRALPLEEWRHPHGHPVRVVIDGRPWLAFGRPFPSLRVPADLASVRDPGRYEAFTCLAPGVRFEKGRTRIPPDATWAWQAGAMPVNAGEQADLLGRGALGARRAWLHLRDVESGKPVLAHGGSVAWNRYRRRWIAIVLEAFGTPSFLGEIWYAEADTPVGPWVWARRVVTHRGYSFYNPKHHPEFDREGGRRIFFEGTYTLAFSGTVERTPRYDYNQVLYGLSLDDPRLVLPAPVYRLRDGRLAQRDGVEAADAWEGVEAALFHAPDRPAEGLVAFAEGFYAPPVLAAGFPEARAILWRRPDGSLALERGADAVAVARVWPHPGDLTVLDPTMRPPP